MNIEIKEFVSGARCAKGLVVIIDVFRASTTLAVLLSRSAGPVYPFDGIEAFRRHAPQLGNPLIFSELEFAEPHLDNSPSQALEAELDGRTLVSVTTNGSRGLAGAPRESEVISAGFVNASAAEEYIRLRNPELVTLVAMGVTKEEEEKSAIEDLALARLLRDRLSGQNPEASSIQAEIRASAQKWIDRWRDRKPYIERDAGLALTLDAFPAIPLLDRSGGLPRLIPGRLK